jgi:hypothetical protein
MGLYRGLGLGNVGAILGWFSGAGGAVLCAKRAEINTAFVSQSITPESLHETMFCGHVLETKIYMLVSGQSTSKSSCAEIYTQHTHTSCENVWPPRGGTDSTNYRMLCFACTCSRSMRAA